MEAQLKAAVLDSQKNLGELEPWQKTIFTEEAVPQYQRFIKDYRASTEGVKEDVDLESLKSYLAFYAPKFRSKLEPASAPSTSAAATSELKIWVLLKGDRQCKKCVQSTANIKHLAKSRLGRRGLTPIWGELTEAKPSVPDLSRDLSRDTAKTESQSAVEAKKKGAVGTLVIQWFLAPVDDADSAHADENRYIIRAFLQVGGVTLEARHQEILDNDSFESSEARLLTELFTELGSKFRTDSSALAAREDPGILPAAVSGSEEISVEVSGIRDFTQYQRVKANLQDQLKSIATVEDRKFSREKIGFAVFSTQGKDEVEKLVDGSSLDPEAKHPLKVVVQ